MFGVCRFGFHAERDNDMFVRCAPSGCVKAFQACPTYPDSGSVWIIRFISVDCTSTFKLVVADGAKPPILFALAIFSVALLMISENEVCLPHIVTAHTLTPLFLDYWIQKSNSVTLRGSQFTCSFI